MRGQQRAGRPGDHRCTPAVIYEAALEALGITVWDLDPASNPNSTVPAILELYEGGLEEPWGGHVWVNPPFSDINPWVEKVFDNEWDSLTFLGPHDLSTKWARRMTSGCNAWAAWPRRVHFPVPGQPKGSPPAGIALWYFGSKCEIWLERMRAKRCIAYPGHPHALDLECPE